MASSNIICPLCKDTVNKLLYRFRHDSERSLIEKIKHEFPEWTVNDCAYCHSLRLVIPKIYTLLYTFNIGLRNIAASLVQCQ